jgi:hypothetical protein
MLRTMKKQGDLIEQTDLVIDVISLRADVENTPTDLNHHEFYWFYLRKPVALKSNKDVVKLSSSYGTWVGLRKAELYSYEHQSDQSATESHESTS